MVSAAQPAGAFPLDVELHGSITYRRGTRQDNSRAGDRAEFGFEAEGGYPFLKLRVQTLAIPDDNLPNFSQMLRYTSSEAEVQLKLSMFY